MVSEDAGLWEVREVVEYEEFVECRGWLRRVVVDEEYVEECERVEVGEVRESVREFLNRIEYTTHVGAR